jgi:hypothetical protein
MTTTQLHILRKCSSGKGACTLDVGNINTVMCKKPDAPAFFDKTGVTGTFKVREIFQPMVSEDYHVSIVQ